MKHISICDVTLCRDGNYSFNEKIEISRLLNRLQLDVIEFPAIKNPKVDILLCRTASSFLTHAVISVGAGQDFESIENAAQALRFSVKSRIRIELPVSVVGMEYLGHKKPQKMLEWISAAVKAAKETGHEVEFSAQDATRAEANFLQQAIIAAEQAGADSICLCDTAGVMLPDDFASLIKACAEDTKLPLSVRCSNLNDLATAQAILALSSGAVCVKTAVSGDTVSLQKFATMLQNCGERFGFSSNLKYTELRMVVRQIKRFIRRENEGEALAASEPITTQISLDSTADAASIRAASEKLGYFLTDEDVNLVMSEINRLSSDRKIEAKELDAIVASVAMQGPATYTLESFVINSGNLMDSSAQVTLRKDDKKKIGICLGNGPIDAAFHAIEQIVGCHYELDDFQIQSVTQGKEAMGSAIVKLRSGNSVYAGSGISTDIIGAGIRAYINAVNKILNEEGN